MRVEEYPWSKSQALAEDYVHNIEKARAIFPYHPSVEANWSKRAKWLDQSNRFTANRSELVKVLLEYNKIIGNTSEAIENIKSLEDPSTLAVVGGQQTGLFTGPLLVIYKAITLIQSAKHAEKLLNRKVIPVFWLAGEDHDFDEVNHTFTLTQQLEVSKIRIDHPTGIRCSVSKLTIQQWEEAIQQLDNSLMHTEFKAGLIHKLSEIGAQSLTLVDFFARIFVWLFREQGLILMDSDNPAIRGLEGPMFSQLLQKHEIINQAYLQGKDRVEALGYKAQSELAPHNVNLFVFTDQGERVLLQWDGHQYHDKKKERSFTVDEMNHWAETCPERLSNNVMTRPLMQEFLFPVLATVLGPGEIAYWGLTGLAFEALGMEMPIIIPRMEFTLIEGTVAKQMDKFTLSFETVVEEFELWKQEWLTAQDQLGLPARFTEAKQQFNQVYGPIVDTLAGINPGLRKLGETNMHKIIEQMEFLEAKAVEANLVQYEAALRHLDRIRLTLYPLGKPQERVYNIIGYLNKYGESFLQQLLELPYTTEGSHRIIYI
ncbi:bacillithiol biosynthesis cysteine-adding enzyme BshC [Paenibacillus psychroresistens]|uniref:Putative cysteine ligase BshC n=1 Tax=Paenibacillus psychroresistens TaxID=1778678 RepID=A0A6B8RJI0_9BACL|nr:bacillithiol biosynthesis cysteine-adding enzyme BshC [Paenibacillus psychroresistens]QGQ95765.1 bacillithiol biosynthesis cysteine-adding enzyme BshC [Paenibacillus psychroresistens]